jgi:hypothetical protein
MATGMDPEPWGLLHDGMVVGVEQRGEDATVRISARHVRKHLDGSTGDFVLHLSGVEKLVYLPYSDRWDEPEVEDPELIVRAKHAINDAALEGGELVVWGAMGSLRLIYGELRLELDDGSRTDPGAIRGAVRAFWDDWRASQALAGLHPLIREALTGTWSESSRAPLLAAWRTERKSDLGDALEHLDAATWPDAFPDVTEPKELDDWRERFDAAPSAALAQLTRCANATFYVLAEEEDQYVAEHGLRAWLDARSERSARFWKALTQAVAMLLGNEPDPRIGRTVVRMLRSPSDHWYRIDQVAHVAGPFEAKSDAPSFADHALFLIEHHADAGTPKRLEERAASVSIEADCNGANMAGDLRGLAKKLRERFGADRPLAEAASTSLSRRTLQRDR